MLKNILSVIAGLVAAWVLFTCFQLFNYLILPKPDGFVSTDPSSMKEMIDNMPVYGWVVLVLGYVIGSFAGGWVIGKVAESKTRIFPLIAAVLFMLGWLGTIMTIPHPIWIVILVFLVYIPSALTGHKMAIGKTA